MNYSNMIKEDGLKKTFIVATLISTIMGTFTTGMNLYERVLDKAKQNRKDAGQDAKIDKLQQQLNDQQKMRETQTQQNQVCRRPDQLQDSLARGGPMVGREYDCNFARLGPRFAEGDDITQNQLQGQVIMLQGTVINLLEDALYTGRLRDVSKLYNASEFAREGSIRAMRDQYQRMLQAAPVRRPMGPVRRISSTPAMAGDSSALVIRQNRNGDGRSIKSKTTRVKESRVEEDSRSDSRGSVAKATSAANMPVMGGPLFCSYAIKLQRSDMEMDSCFGKDGTGACPDCGTKVLVSEGKAWRIDKTIRRGGRTTEQFDEDLYEQRTYLVENRFVVKCHREQAGFACVLCARFRDYDTVCGDAAGLVKHLWKKHEVDEYEQDVDISELSMFEKKVKLRY